MIDQSSDFDRIESIVAGDQEGFRYFVEKYQDFIFTLTFKILKNHSDAEEASQDTFVKAFQALGKFSGKSKFSTWLYRIAFNTAISYKRKNRIEVSQFEEDAYKVIASGATSDDLHRKEQQKFIESAINRLLPADAAIITLYYHEEKNLEEIEKITGIKRNALKVKLFRARKKLAEELHSELNMETESLMN